MNPYTLYISGLDWSEVGRTLGLSRSTAIRHARQHAACLRQALAQGGETE